MLSIGNFSKIALVTTKTLRYYDEIGLLKPTNVDSDTGYRYYNVEQLKDILLINKLKLYDFSLEEIKIAMKNSKDNKFILSLVLQKKIILEEKLSSYEFVLRQLKEDIKSLERGNNIMSYLDNIEVNLIETSPMNILSSRKKIKVTDFGKHLGELYERIVTENLTPVGAPMSINHGEEFDPDNYDMEIAIPIKEVVTGTRDFKSCLCASATLKGPYTEITSMYSKIRDWIEKEGYVAMSSPFEIYATDPSKTLPEENITEIYFPVRKL